MPIGRRVLRWKFFGGAIKIVDKITRNSKITRHVYVSAYLKNKIKRVTDTNFVTFVKFHFAELSKFIKFCLYLKE